MTRIFRTAVFSSCLFVVSVAAAVTPPGPGPEVRDTRDLARARYIVVLKEDAVRVAGDDRNGPRAAKVRDIAQALATAHNGRLLNSFGRLVDSAALELSVSEAHLVASDPRVAAIEKAAALISTGTQTFSPLNAGDWGLTRIDEPTSLATGAPGFSESEYHYENQGAGTIIYVIDAFDSMLATPSAEFVQSVGTGPSENRVSTLGFQFTRECEAGGAGIVANAPLAGHGIFVTAIAAGKTRGVAKLAKVRAIRALCDYGVGGGDLVDLLSAMTFLLQDYTANFPQNLAASPPIRRPRAVVNMSFGYLMSYGTTAQNDELRNAMKNLAENYKVVFVVAAGNSNQDACDTMPARLGVSPNNSSYPNVGGVAGVITVGASLKEDGTLRDKKSAISNWGNCVDVFAPGKDITSVNEDGTYSTSFGTSFAAPFVTGVIATYLEQRPEMSAAGIEAKADAMNEYLNSYLTESEYVIDPNPANPSVPRTVNKMLYNGIERLPGGPALDSDAVAKPTFINVPANTNGTFTVDWNSTGAGPQFQLFEARDASFYDQKVVYEGPDSKFLLTGHSGTYYFRVRSCTNDFTLCSAYREPGTTASDPGQSIATPTLMESTDGMGSTDGKYSVSWTSSGSGITYKLERNGALNYTYNLIYTGTALTKTQSFTNNGIRTYHVKACLTSNLNICSPWSNEVEVETDFGQ